VRDLKVLTLEEAVYRMTGLSAHQFGIRNRGRISTGQYADLTVFDPAVVKDTATFEQPISPAVGIRYVLVNGRLALDDGVPTGIRAGRVFRRADLTDDSFDT
jgi:N-acyl-D-amino-acid deacylase